MTITVCISREFQRHPGKHVNRWNKVRSVRAWFAIAWYRFDDCELVTRPHEWSNS